MLNLSVLLEESARRYAHRPAFSFAGASLSFREVDHAANRVANGLRQAGISPGDKVAISCPNLPYFPILYYGILKAGAVVVPLNILLKTDEIVFHLADSDAKAYICYAGSAELPMGRYGKAAFDQVPGCGRFFLIHPEDDSRAGAPTDPDTYQQLIEGQPTTFETHPTGADDTAVIIYTSGTTGSPKGAELTHSNLFSNAILSTDILRSAPHDVQLVVLPLFHIFGMTVLMNAGLYKGVHGILLPRFDAAAVFALIGQYRISILAAVPSMYWALLHHRHPQLDDSVVKAHLRICISGGASLPVAILEGFEQRFEVPIIEGYGMSEGSPVVTFNQLDVGCKPGSIGTPVWGVEVKVVDASGAEMAPGEKGELVYRGPNVMKGYYKNPAATAATIRNGWLHSGDVATKDADGFFYIVDRIKEIIIRGGYNIYPREIEELLLQHEAISMAAVVGVPCERMGEEVKAFVVLKPGASVAPEALLAWTKERIAANKYPRHIAFVDTLPLSASGKILKKLLTNG